MADAALCNLLEWDTDFFGVRVARVIPARLTSEMMLSALDWCHANAIQLLYLLAESDDTLTIRLAEDHGFRFVDIRMSFERSLSDQDLPAASPYIRPTEPGDLPALLAIARTSFRASRFYHDSHITSEQANALYETWIAKSCNGYADAVLVADLDGQPQGMVSCHLRGNIGTIGLVGVSQAARGRGLGYALVMASLRFFVEQGVQEAHVVTQGRNIAAQRLYQACGLKTHAVHLWYHRWFDL